jgi:hypothetical protein
MALIIQLGQGAFMSSFSVHSCNPSWNAHQRNQPFEENEQKDIGKSQTYRKEGNDRINKVLAMRPGLAWNIETVCVS